MQTAVLVVVALMLSLPAAEAFDDMKTCYILDGILILYGIVLTVLYCRLKMQRDNVHSSSMQKKSTQAYDANIYAGLEHKTVDTYETINIAKKPIV